MRLLAAGSIALDSLKGPFGSVQGELGGSALYFSLAASLIAPLEICAPVGRNDLERVNRIVGDRPIDLSRLTVLDHPTYRWSARQESGTNHDLGGQDSIYDEWKPSLPPGFDGWAFVGSMRPDRQAEIVRALSETRLLAGDSMQSYVTARPAEAEEVLSACDWFFANEAETRALGGDPASPDEFRRRWGIAGLVVKAGPEGCTVWTDAGRVHVPAMESGRVVDVTGAGDALAGGMLARWSTTGGAASGLADAIAHGVACAALAISDVGLAGLARSTR
ncbi:MAG: PfkB family carbohydrate kinase, partial [Candidatus Dormibacteraeota bacterium]|nr:PfkB family carbohydrate kinase [Candidatus Dormibacteraeota bacterium]